MREDGDELSFEMLSPSGVEVLGGSDTFIGGNDAALDIIKSAVQVGKQKKDFIRATFHLKPRPKVRHLQDSTYQEVEHCLVIRIQVKKSTTFKEDFLGRALRLAGLETALPKSLRTTVGEASWSPRDFYDSVHVTDPKVDAHLPESDEIKCQLLPFQQRAVTWMLEREKGHLSIVDQSDDAVVPYDFVSVVDADSEKCFVSQLFGLITTSLDWVLPAATVLKGGILSEEMGLGKTVEVIALVCMNKQQDEVPEQAPSDGLRPSRATLVITPPAILQQWKDEIGYLTPGLKVYHYEGVRQETDKATHEEVLKMLCAQDIVLTTFNVLAKEIHYAEKYERTLRHEKKYERRESLLTSISWWRVVLDEAQMIEGGTNNAAKVATLIARENAWCVSGTPVKKDFNDIFGLLLFLRYRPYCEMPKLWRRLVLQHKPLFQRLVKQLTLRHNKDQIKDELTLPAQKRVVITMPFSHIEEQHYGTLFQQMAAECGLDIRGAPLEADWSPELVISEMRSWLSRLRQTCLHPEVGTKNRRALGGRGPLRTVNEVLEVMIEQNQTSIRTEERKMLLSQLVRGQILEHADLSQDALDVWLSTLEEVEPIVKDSQKQLIAAVEQAAKTTKSNADPGKEESEDALRSTLPFKARYRSALELEHMCVFFTGNAYYQLKEAEHERTIQEYRMQQGTGPSTESNNDHAVPEGPIVENPVTNATPAEPENHQPSSGGFPALDAVIEKAAAAGRDTSAENPIPELPKSELYVQFEALEDAAYERAKQLRATMLSEARSKADIPIQKIRDATSTFLEIPDVSADLERGGIESKDIFDKIKALFKLMQSQSKQIQEWRQKTAELLSIPLVDESELDKQNEAEDKGKEYETSTMQQHESYVYVDALHALISDRHETITGQRNFAVDTDMKTKLKKLKEDRWESGAPELLQQLWKVRAGLKFTDDTGSIRGLLTELREAKLKFRDGVDRGNRRAEIETTVIDQATAALNSISSKQSKAMTALDREIELFKDATNLRAEYYRQLQAISDSVAPWEKDLTVEVRDRLLENKGDDEEFLRMRIRSLTSKARYLIHLRNDAMDSDTERLCIICQYPFETGVLTSCGHTYCLECLKMWWKAHRTCPTCKKVLIKQDFHAITYKPKELRMEEEQAATSPMALSSKIGPLLEGENATIYSGIREKTLNEIKNIDLDGSYGTKIDTIARHVLWIREHDPGAKSIVFSQYRDFLEVLGRAFKRFKIGHTGIDRRNGIEDFKTDPSMECFFLHAKAHSSGLNLVNATHVFLCEPLINTAIELQAIARVHRIGQHHETTVWMYLVDGTVEKAIYDISVQRRMTHIQSKTGSAAAAAAAAGPSPSTSQAEISRTVADTVTSYNNPDTVALEHRLEAANTAEMEDTAMADLLTKGSGGGELVPSEDLWECLFRHTPSLIGDQGSEQIQREVAKGLGADAAEMRIRGG